MCTAVCSMRKSISAHTTTNKQTNKPTMNRSSRLLSSITTAHKTPLPHSTISLSSVRCIHRAPRHRIHQLHSTLRQYATSSSTTTTTTSTTTTTTATATTTTTSAVDNNTAKGADKPWTHGPGLHDFIRMSAAKTKTQQEGVEDAMEEEEELVPNIPPPYLSPQQHEQQYRQMGEDMGDLYDPTAAAAAEQTTMTAHKRPTKVYVETYGCQMNVNDTEIVLSIMGKAGYTVSGTADEADVVFVNTCSIRDNAEQRVWKRLEELRAANRRLKRHERKVVGILGCMAERLKDTLLESGLVSVVAGPDAYRDLPHLIDIATGSAGGAGQRAINVVLSLDETYADISPVRLDDNGVSAFVTIMRGCNNMCSYCIVPFTRGRERSRPVQSIEEEVRQLSAQGYREITLLGQNVNSYNDTSTRVEQGLGLREDGLPALSSDGFRTIYKLGQGGVRFTELVDRISRIDPEMRIRFTSPHPKDFPDDLLALIRDRPNVCKQVHMPAQSGDTELLRLMRRGYSREAYLELAHRIRATIPGVTLSSDFISGFCGETEEMHRNTLSLLDEVQYEHAFLFAYSMRERTNAHRRLKDDVPEEVKQRRLTEVIERFRVHMLAKNADEVGRTHLLLVDGASRRSQDHLVGRTDTNKKVVVPKHFTSAEDGSQCSLEFGDYVAVRVVRVQGQTLFGEPLYRTTLTDFFNRHGAPWIESDKEE